MKQCSRCKEVKAFNSFCKTKLAKDGYQPACKSCMAISWRNSRNKKPEHYAQIQQDRERRNKQRFDDWKQTQKCTLCPEDSIECLDMHHLDPNSKDFNISDRARQVSAKTLFREIEKCIVLCSNCHRKVHADNICLIL